MLPTKPWQKINPQKSLTGNDTKRDSRDSFWGRAARMEDRGWRMAGGMATPGKVPPAAHPGELALVSAFIIHQSIVAAQIAQNPAGAGTARPPHDRPGTRTA